MIIIRYLKNNFAEALSITLISFLPIIFLCGSAVVTSSIVLLDFLFLYILIDKKILNYLNNKFFYSFIFIWTVLLLSLFFSHEPQNSMQRALGFVRFIIFIFLIRYFFGLENKNFQKIILSAWSLIFLLISLDLIYEYFIGVNIIGIKSPMHGRLSSFLGDELNIGAWYYAFISVVLANLYYNINSRKNLAQFNSIFFYLLIFIFLVVAFIIGERSNFLKIATLLILFVFFFERRNYLIKISFILITILSLSFIISQNEPIKNRFWVVFLKPFITNPVSTLNNSEYGRLYASALEMYNNNKIFGVGLKNYRSEIYKNEYIKYHAVKTTHPHQIHFEILAELGFVGYVSFLIFFLFNFYFSIKFYIKKKNLFNLSGILFVTCYIIPFLPSGSFFTTFGASLFWLNFAFMLPKEN